MRWIAIVSTYIFDSIPDKNTQFCINKKESLLSWMRGVLYVPILGAPRVFTPEDIEGYRKARFGVAPKVPYAMAGLFRTFVRQIPAASLSCYSWFLCDEVLDDVGSETTTDTLRLTCINDTASHSNDRVSLPENLTKTVGFVSIQKIPSLQ